MNQNDFNPYRIDKAGGRSSTPDPETKRKLRVCVYHSDILKSWFVNQTLNRMFGHFDSSEIVFLVVKGTENKAIEWAEEHNIPIETFDLITNNDLIRTMIEKGGIDLYLEFGAFGIQHSYMKSCMDGANIYTYLAQPEQP